MSLPPRIPKVNVAAGLYVNRDTFIEADIEVFNWIKKQSKTPSESVILKSPDEVAYVLDEALMKGGREFLVSKTLHDKLKAMFTVKEGRLGGNGYNMGLALYELKLNPIVSYPCRPPGIMRDSPDFRVACLDGIKTPRQAIRERDPEYDHLIIEFIENKNKGIHASGRLILSWDLMSFQGIFDEYFFTYGFKKEYTDILILGYAHLLLPTYKKRTDVIVDALSPVKRPMVHLEFGEGSEESSVYAMKKFADSQTSDSWGFNEKECVRYLGAKSDKIEDLKEAASIAAKQYGLRRICVHTQEFTFTVSMNDARKESQALNIGNLVAAAQTLGGISRNINMAKKLPKSNIEAKTEALEGGYIYVQTPSRINPNPKILTGLGDVFTGVQAAYALS